jgi:RNA polymerase sigma-70 factor, ECF subfamily
MSHLRLVSSCPNPEPAVRKAPVDHPCLEAFRRDFSYLIRTLRRLGVSRDDVEDLAHEVFLVLYRTWATYDPTRPFRAYLFGIAFRVACGHLRKRRREVSRAELEIDDFGPRPDQEFETNQKRALLLKALERIPLANRAVLVMHDIDELPMAEIASNLSILRFTGYSRLRRARRELAAAVAALSQGREP